MHSRPHSEERGGVEHTAQDTLKLRLPNGNGHAIDYMRIVCKSQLGGIKEFAENQLSSKVRIARPKIIKDLPESFSGPSFSTSIGLLEYAINEHFINNDKKAFLSKNKKFSFTKIGDWLRQNF